MKLQNERELIKKAFNEPEAFSEIYNYYFPRIYNYVRYRITNIDIADDLTSQIFEKAFSKLKTYKPERGDFNYWIFTIANNTLSDYFRDEKRRNWTSIENLLEPATDKDNPLEHSVTDEMKYQINIALTKLSDRDRNIIALKFWSGISNRKIAELMELKENHIAVILFRNMRKLREILEGQGVNFYE